MKSKKLLSEIDRNRELMGLDPLNERYEDLPLINDTYPNITFHDRTKNDRLPKNLLDDIQSAAEFAGITVQVDWAKTGHRNKTKSGNTSRHSLGWAVDLSHVNGKGWEGKSSAKKSGIYDEIENFVSYLKSAGYKINSESGNDKAILYFGFPAHDDHLHVSNKSGQPSPSVDDLDVKSTNKGKGEPNMDEPEVDGSEDSDVKVDGSISGSKKDKKPKTAADAFKSFFDYELPELDVLDKIKSFFK
jgi:hypothetical protein